MTSPSQQESFRVCVFELAGQDFGLRLSAVREVVPMAALARPPAMPSLLEGFLNLRGAFLPVLRTAVLLGLTQDRLQLHTPLVIARSRRSPLALLVNRVTGVVTTTAAAVMPIAASDSFNGCVDGRLATGGQDVNLLSIDRLLLEKEQQVLAEFQATETRRLRQIDARAS